MPEGFDVKDSVYLIQTRAMSKRYEPVIPKNLGAFKRSPGRDKAPRITLPPPKKQDFPEGLYVGVSGVDDLYVLQSVRPVRALLTYSRETAARILEGNSPLPFNPREIILVLDPYFPQALEPVLAAEIPELLRKGYHQFMVNNPGHYSYFRNTAAELIAGPYLYTFNSWAAAFVSSLGTDYLVSPLENNRQNLEKTFPAGTAAGKHSAGRRPFTFITLFAYPSLFRIRANLGGVYDFKEFQDSRGESFRLLNRAEGSLVIPERPFSIVDKIPFLREAGFRRFILDFSGPPLKKKDDKDVMEAVKNAAPLPNTVRFNWKDGFFTVKE
jgi:putative protease